MGLPSGHVYGCMADIAWVRAVSWVCAGLEICIFQSNPWVNTESENTPSFYPPAVVEGGF